MGKIGKIIALTMLTLLGAALLFAAIGAAIVWLEFLAPSDTRITDVLLRDRRYDPAKKFTFDRACVYPPEAGTPNEMYDRKYRQLDPDLPGSHTNWTLLLIDDHAKTYRHLWIEDPRVAFDGKSLCVPKLVLIVEETPTGLVAHAQW